MVLQRTFTLLSYGRGVIHLAGMIKAQQILLTKYTDFDRPIVFDDTEDSNFKLITKEYDVSDDELLRHGEIFIQVIYLSNDPAQKGWFTPYKSYKAVTPLGEIAPADGIARVLASKNPRFPKGCYVETFTGWCDYRILDTQREKCHIVDPHKVPLAKYLSLFGGTTMTAYFTVFHYAPQAQNRVWMVTGAAGAAGSSCVQFISKVLNPKLVIAVAGGKDKCQWVETLGSRVKCLDYKDPGYKKDLFKLLNADKSEIDVLVDHVGGWILNNAILYMSDFSTVVQVGAVAGYNSPSDGFTNYANVITKRITIKGMIVMDHAAEFGRAAHRISQWLKDGTLDVNNFPEHIVQAIGSNFTNVPQLWTQLFQGVNRGKYITQVNEYAQGRESRL